MIDPRAVADRCHRHAIFPDFAVQQSSDPTRRWLWKIVGFWDT